MQHKILFSLLIGGIVIATSSANDGGAKPRVDVREQASFPPHIKIALKQRMRENLMYVNQIGAALSENDLNLAADIAEYKLGLSSLGPHNARQEPYMPQGMRHIGMEMHKASSRLARVAQEGDQLRAFKSLSEVTNLCVACHATYRAK